MRDCRSTSFISAIFSTVLPAASSPEPFAASGRASNGDHPPRTAPGSPPRDCHSLRQDKCLANRRCACTQLTYTAVFSREPERLAIAPFSRNSAELSSVTSAKIPHVVGAASLGGGNSWLLSLRGSRCDRADLSDTPWALATALARSGSTRCTWIYRDRWHQTARGERASDAADAFTALRRYPPSRSFSLSLFAFNPATLAHSARRRCFDDDDVVPSLYRPLATFASSPSTSVVLGSRTGAPLDNAPRRLHAHTRQGILTTLKLMIEYRKSNLVANKFV